MTTTASKALAVVIVAACNVAFSDDQLRPFASRLEIPDWAKTKNVRLCKALLADLRKWQNVSEIAPVAIADAIKSPGVIDAFGKCNAEKLLTSYQIEPRVWRENNLDALSPEERQQYGTAFSMTGELRLYRANIDNDPTGSQELIVYGTELISRGELVKFASEFHVLDIHSCTITNTAQTFDSPRNTRFFVGLLRHGARTYIFDGNVYPNEFDLGRTQKVAVRLQQWTYAKKTNLQFFSNACNYEGEVE